MDAIKKKMSSLKNETDNLIRQIQELEDFTAQRNKDADSSDATIRDIGKRIANMETQYDDASEKLIVTEHKLEDIEKDLGFVEQEVSALSRRISLLEGEARIAEERLGRTVIDLANTCKLVL